MNYELSQKIVNVFTGVLGIMFIFAGFAPMLSANNYSLEQILVSLLFWGLLGLTLVGYSIFSLKDNRSK